MGGNAAMGIYSASSTGNVSYVSSKLTFTAPYAYEVSNNNMEIICSDGLGDDDSCLFVITEGITIIIKLL